MRKNQYISKLQSRLIGKNLSDAISELQDLFRKRIFILKELGNATYDILENDYDIDCFFGSDERLENAVISSVDLDTSNKIFSFEYYIGK